MQFFNEARTYACLDATSMHLQLFLLHCNHAAVACCMMHVRAPCVDNQRGSLLILGGLSFQGCRWLAQKFIYILEIECTQLLLKYFGSGFNNITISIKWVA